MSVVNDFDRAMQELESADARKIEVRDGYSVDAITGEIIEAIAPPEFTKEKTMGDGLAHWVLSKILRNRSRSAASALSIQLAEDRIQARKDKACEALELEADMIEDRRIIANAQAIVKESHTAATFFINRYSHDLLAWTKMQIGTGTQKHYKTDYANVHIVTTNPLVSIIDADKALATAKEKKWPLKESLLIGSVPQTFKDDLIKSPTKAAALGFSVREGSEDVEIK
jgi:hypothetical protein